MMGKYINTKEILSVEQIDWPNWEPKERAVICFLKDSNKIMLIHKKTGLGAGKINAPGGRIDPGENAKQAAVREVMEETFMKCSDLEKVGELFFIFTNGYSLHGTVFFTHNFSGIPTSTPEADPFWCDINKIPYNDMWEDDKYWLPHTLCRKYIEGYFIFDEDVMLSKNVIIKPR